MNFWPAVVARKLVTEFFQELSCSISGVNNAHSFRVCYGLCYAALEPPFDYRYPPEYQIQARCRSRAGILTDLAPKHIRSCDEAKNRSLPDRSTLRCAGTSYELWDEHDKPEYSQPSLSLQIFQ